MLKPKKKTSIIKEHRTHEKDTGSSEVQIALLCKQIEALTAHLKKHAKDQHSRRGLLQMVSKRKSLMDYLKKTSTRRYNSLVKKVGLKK
jgi:small subunit ribosomal protein S15